MMNQKMPDKVKFYSCPSGDRKKPIYKYQYDEKYGCPRRIQNGFADIQDYIQASADDIDFNVIGKMLVSTTDNVVGHFKVEGETFDLTGMPRNVHEYASLQNRIQDEFAKFPDDIRDLFGNDLELFRKSYLNGSIGKILETYAKSKIESPKPEESKGDEK